MKKHAVILVALVVVSSFCLTPFSVPQAHASIPRKLNAFSEGERLLYTRVVEAFRKNQLSEAVKQRDLLGRNYPTSVHLDNAYYLTGVLNFQANHYAEAVRLFGVVEARFPYSNKRPAAMFAKARTYELLGLKPQAVRLWKTILKEYPGSQESSRARMQLQVAKMDLDKKKR